MNVRVHRAVSDLDGTTGMRITEATVAGERYPVKLAQLRHPNCQKTPEEFVGQTSGHWREDHLFSLEQSFEMYQAVERRIKAYDRKIMQNVKKMEREDLLKTGLRHQTMRRSLSPSRRGLFR